MSSTMVRRFAWLVLLAACHKGGDKPKPMEPVGSGSGSGSSSGSSATMVTPMTDADVTLALPPAPPVPAVPASLPPLPGNPRITPEAVALGELLFHDPRLSANGDRSCSSCHDPAHGYAGTIQEAADGKPNLRRTPTLVNLAWVKELGWDGRYASFADLLPAHIKGQLGDPIDPASARIAQVPAYRAHIARVGGEPRDAIAQALEAYVMTRYDGDAPWDRLERTALSRPGGKTTDPVLAGYQLFMGKAQCGVCHLPPLYTDGKYHVVAPSPVEDLGRGRVDPAQKGAFRTPTLRGAARRRQFFHGASATSLDEAVHQYLTMKQAIDPAFAKIRFDDAEQKQIVAFLMALTANVPAPTNPVLP